MKTFKEYIHEAGKPYVWKGNNLVRTKVGDKDVFKRATKNVEIQIRNLKSNGDKKAATKFEKEFYKLLKIGLKDNGDKMHQLNKDIIAYHGKMMKGYSDKPAAVKHKVGGIGD